MPTLPYWVLHKIKFSFNQYSLLSIISYKNKAWVLHQGQKEMVIYIYIYVYLFFQYTINPLKLYIKCSYYYKQASDNTTVYKPTREGNSNWRSI